MIEKNILEIIISLKKYFLPSFIKYKNPKQKNINNGIPTINSVY